MIEDTKLMYEATADTYIPGWRKLDKNQLCNLYIEHENDEVLKSAYLGAIICKYWNSINNISHRSFSYCTSEDAYDILLEAITYALKMRKWLDPESSIYGDKAGPDKAINRKTKHLMFNFHWYNSKRDKRKINANILSTDSLAEDFNDFYLRNIAKEDSKSELVVKDYLSNFFNKKEYFIVFMLYYIVYENVFDTDPELGPVLNRKKLKKRISNLDDTDCYGVAMILGIEPEQIITASKYIRGLSDPVIYYKIDFSLRKLKSLIEQDISESDDN